jgi:hypothetical protein
VHREIVAHCLQDPDAVLHESIAMSKVGEVPDTLFAVATIVNAVVFCVTNSTIDAVVLAFWLDASINVKQLRKGSACATVEINSSDKSRIFFILPVVTLVLKILLKAFRNNDKTRSACKFCARLLIAYSLYVGLKV